MSKEILLVYQDCPMCGSRKEWGEKQTEVANKYGFSIRNVSFVSREATDAKLMWKAVKQGIRNYPFFTDGVKFSKDLSDFVEKPAENAKKSSKKPAKSAAKSTRKKKTEVKDGVSTEN